MNNVIIYDLEKHNTDRGRPYVFCFYRLSKLAWRYSPQYKIKKCKTDNIAFDGDDCVTNALDFCLKLKREERKDDKKKTLQYNFQLHTHKGSRFDT